MSIKKTLNDIWTIFKEKRIIEILLLVVFLIQGVILIYFNWKTLSNHMGYDSSWSYLKAALIWKEKSINSKVWVDQTSIFLDSSLPLASLIYGITGKIFPSYGLANLIIVLCILLSMNSILCNLNLNSLSRLLAVNLIICPYLTNGYAVVNDLGYFSNTLAGPAFYSLRALIALLIIREFLVIKKTNHIDIIGFITLALCSLAGSSSGIFMIVMILFPYLVFELEKVFVCNDIKILKSKDVIYCITGILCVYGGKIFANRVLGVNAIDTTRTWTSIEKLFTNFGAPLQGFLKLIGALPINQDTSVAILSVEGIYRIFPLCILGIIILSIVFALKVIKNNWKTDDELILLVVNIVVVNYITFGLFNAQYGSAFFEERYLICTFMMLIVLVAYYLDKLDMNQLFSKIIPVLLLVCLLGNNYVSDKAYIETTNDSWQIDEICAIVNNQNADLIYFWGDELSAVGRSLRAYDLNHTYKNINTSGGFHHNGDYLYKEDNSDYSGSTILVVSKDSTIVPENIMGMYEKIAELDYVNVYYCESNPIDLVAGITGDKCIDMPNTPGIVLGNGTFDGTSYISEGTAGFVMFGPHCSTKSGTYDFTLYYQIIDGEDTEESYFDVATDGGRNVLGKIELDPSKKAISINDVHLEEGTTLEYRVYNGEGTRIKIDKVEIIKK